MNKLQPYRTTLNNMDLTHWIRCFFRFVILASLAISFSASLLLGFFGSLVSLFLGFFISLVSLARSLLGFLWLLCIGLIELDSLRWAHCVGLIGLIDLDSLIWTQ